MHMYIRVYNSHTFIPSTYTTRTHTHTHSLTNSHTHTQLLFQRGHMGSGDSGIRMLRRTRTLPVQGHVRAARRHCRRRRAGMYTSSKDTSSKDTSSKDTKDTFELLDAIVDGDAPVYTFKRVYAYTRIRINAHTYARVYA